MGRFQIGNIKNERKYLRDLIFEKLQQAIFSGKFKPDERITEKAIAKELRVSRTPVREALYRLASTGVIKIIPHRGFLISKWSSKEIKDVIELRIALEVFAVKLAIKRILPNEINELKILIVKMEKAVKKEDMLKASYLNSLFHDKIVLASKNKELFKVMEPIKNKIYHFRIISIFTPSRLKGSYKEHKGILNALISKNAELAQKLISQHIQKVGSIIEKKLKEKKEKIK
jgi:DNA-binding GntR family transcriptional regulator